MAYIIAIETSTEICSVALGKDGQCVALQEDERENSHAEKVIVYIDEVLRTADVSIGSVDAVCISEGPGSYTGLRIGVSTAKGLCYALHKPLIAVPTLQAMAYGARGQFPQAAQFCPMIDARRMEVYSAVYNNQLEILDEITNIIVDADFYADFLRKDAVVFSGNAVPKVQPVLSGNPQAIFASAKTSARYLLELAHEKHLKKDFADTAYFEPFYLKEFRAGK
ncbi:MAG: tRNA (adenosine(37)-N6)-threonylcarbamoyltransferase complex dimerization subunit type 1 TsaB [Lentimicrobiaceae bacterium]|nr:tRNA (adenosine(37)-N6)-threonylcarbamoyltransferase complex dimerization subunit type 1 TsaB [Lentimicrobiaceae bacterium]